MIKRRKREYTMKAIAVYPGKPHSMHLEDMPMPVEVAHEIEERDHE